MKRYAFLLCMLIIQAKLQAFASGLEAAPESNPETFSALHFPGFSIASSEFPGNISVLTSEDIKESKASSIPELLRRLEGINVTDTIGFGLGSDTGINLRGVVNGSRSNVLVLLDGVRQNRLTGDEVHWQSIPIENIERIEILRGGSGLIYGEGALAGVISIITKRQAEKMIEIEAGSELGSYGREKYFVSTKGKYSKTQYGVSYHRSNIGGYRQHTGSRTTTVTSHMSYDALPYLMVQSSLFHSEDTSFYSGGLSPDESQQDRTQAGALQGMFDDQTTQFSIDALIPGPAGLSAAANAFLRYRESDSFSQWGDFAAITPSRGFGIKSSHRQVSNNISHFLVSGIDITDEKASTGMRYGTYSESNKTSYGFFAQETLRIKDRTSLIAGVRYDRASFEEDIQFPDFTGKLKFEGLSPKIGLSFDLNKALIIYGLYSRPFKSPNVDDFSAVVPFGYSGNANLSPQQANDYEAGIRSSLSRIGTLKASFFYTIIDDEILFNDMPGNDQNQNFDTSRKGLEISFNPDVPIPNLKANIAYTFIDATFEKGEYNNKKIPAVPEHLLSTSLSYEPIRNLLICARWRLVQDFYRLNDFGNSFPADNYGVLDLEASFSFKNISAFIKVENATNEEYSSFQSSNGIAISTGENPSPPNSILAGVRLSF